MPTDRLDDLRTRTRYARERYQLYKARTLHSHRPAATGCESSRAFEQAETRLRFAEAEGRRVRSVSKHQQDPQLTHAQVAGVTRLSRKTRARSGFPTGPRFPA